MIQIFLKLYVANEDHSTCSFPVIVVNTTARKYNPRKSMKIHHLSCLSYPSLILLCLEVPATYVCGATYVLVISPTTVTIYQQILLYYFVASSF